jgi:ABC-type glutathione transport system ATPase component
MATPILEVKNLNVRFSTPDGEVHAVKDVNFRIDEGECLGVVGESGSFHIGIAGRKRERHGKRSLSRP